MSNYPDGVTTYDIDYHFGPPPQCTVHGKDLDEHGNCSICDDPIKSKYWEICETNIKTFREMGSRTSANYWYKKQGVVYEM